MFIMKKTIIRCIVSLASQSQYGSVANYVLYRECKNVKPAQVNLVIEEAVTKGYVTVRAVRNFKVYAPTSKAYKLFADARPVSKEDCLLVFKSIAQYEAVNKQYWNVSYKDLARACERRVGAVTFDNVLRKLEKYKYISVRELSQDFVVISTTGVGNKAFAKYN